MGSFIIIKKIISQKKSVSYSGVVLNFPMVPAEKMNYVTSS